MSNNALILSGAENLSVTVGSIADDRDNILCLSSMISSVDSPETQAEAVETIKAGRALLKLVESSRVEVKAPVLECSRKIDTLAKEFCATLVTEVARLDRINTDYNRKLQAERDRIQREQERIAREAEQKRQAELRRLEQARLDAERAELLAVTIAESKQAEAVAAQVAVEIKQVIETPPPAPAQVILPPKAAGQTVQKVWRFEVLDIAAFYAVYPSLCRLEANQAAVNEQIRLGMREAAGLRIFEEIKTRY